MFSLLSLPRASWKLRLAFVAWSAVVVAMMIHQGPHLHDDLALARWSAWITESGGVFYLPTLMVVVVFGRVPKIYQGMFAGLNRTLPGIRADFERQQREQRERSRKF